MTLSMRSHGFTVVDLVFATALVATLAAVSIPPLLRTLDEVQTLGAVRYMSSRLHQARMTAVTRSADTGLRFNDEGDLYSYAVYVDGNGNGLRTRDIDEGIDRQIRASERLSDHFRGVRFGALPELPSVDPGSTPPGDDPIRIGTSDLLTFTSLGTSTPGSLYILSRRDTQYVIRVLGETGKTRILKFDSRRRRWTRL